MAVPLTNLLRGKPKRIYFTPEVKEAFACLKEAFITTLVLKLPDPALAFKVEVDASEVGLGEVLLQGYGTPVKLHPCAFFSRKLTEAERNYDIGNRELLAIKAPLQELSYI